MGKLRMVNINQGGFFAKDLDALKNIETLLNLKEFGIVENDKNILNATKQVLAHLERTIQVYLTDAENPKKIKIILIQKGELK